MTIEPLARHHDRASFDCGKPPLNDYLRTRAREHVEKNVSRTWVGLRDGDPKTIVGYVTTTLSGVAFADLDAEVAARLPRHPVPFLHLACLATDRSLQGRGVGMQLIGFVCRQAVEIADITSCFGVELTAIDDEARTYYERRGFRALVDNRRRLYISIGDLRLNLADE